MASGEMQDWEMVPKGSEQTTHIFDELKKSHDEAYKVIETALRLEEEGKNSEAVQKYETGLVILDKALNLPIECPSNPSLTWEKACTMVQKMRKTRKELLCRIADCQMSPEPSLAAPSSPPSYDEAMSTSQSSADSSNVNQSQITTYRELGDALRSLKIETGAEKVHVIYSHAGVKIYFISPDGTVTATLEPDTLSIVELEDRDGAKPRTYLQVGNWIYPLVPGVSPCFRTEYGAFILPDVHSTVEGAAVGIILPEEADASVFDLLNDILCGIVQAPAAYPREISVAGRRRRDIGYSISHGIVQGAHYVSQGMIRGAEKAGQMMNYGTPKLINHMQPGESPAQINPKVQTGIRVAKNVTQTAASVTGYIASGIGSATMALGRYLAPHIQRQGTRLLSRTCSFSEEEASSKVGSVLEVAAGAVEGFATVYGGLEGAAKILGNSLTTNTVKIVQHKYGQPAGEAAGDTLYTVGNVFVAGNNIKHLTPKGLAKYTAKQTGKAVVEDYRAALRDNGAPGPSHLNEKPPAKAD